MITDRTFQFNTNCFNGKPLFLLVVSGALYFSALRTTAQSLPEGFVYLGTLDSTILIELRYNSDDNFVGTPIDGYESDRLILTRKAALALINVQDEVLKDGYSLKIFDAYRPQRAVNHFMRWTRDAKDTLTKAKYYPNISKDSLVPQGYIWKKSGHSRGSTVDLTLVYKSGKNEWIEVDMGTEWDFFGPESWPNYEGVSDQIFEMRQYLREVMIKHGFAPLREEWWHFTLKDEPFPDTYFDFVIK